MTETGRVYGSVHVFVSLNLVFFQGDLAHLSVANKGACHLIDPLSSSHSDDVAGRDKASSLSDFTLMAQKALTVKIRCPSR